MHLPSLIASLLCGAATLAALAQPAAPAVDWAATTLKDLDFAEQALRERHAGAVAARLDVTVPLEVELPLARAAAQQARTEQDHRRILTRLISSFSDPHTGLYLPAGPRSWAGLVVDASGPAEFKVIAVAPNWPTPLPPLGARVKACDGVWFGTYLRSRVAPLLNLGLEYPSTPSDAARRVMFERGLGWLPRQCQFVLPDGRELALPLQARAIPAEVPEAQVNALLASYSARAKPVGLHAAAPGLLWVGMPDFNPGTSEPAYERLYTQLAQRRQAGGWVVFDLRGNGGGATQLGNRALRALYGERYGKQLDELSAHGKQMVAHPATVALYQELLGKPEFASMKTEIQQELEAMQAALARGERLARIGTQTSAETFAAQRAAVRQRPAKSPRIAAVIDRRCFSSCMGFLLQLQAVGDTVVLGEPTIGYSPYGEIGEHPLPSGLGKLYLPAAYFEAPQATREPFRPDIPYPGRMADDTALMAWVARTLKGHR